MTVTLTTTGQTIRFVESTSEFGVTTRTFAVNAPSGFGNYNPPALAVVNTTDLFSGQQVTQVTPIGGQNGSSLFSYTTGTLNENGAIGETEITILPVSTIPTDTNPVARIPGVVGQILRGIGGIKDTLKNFPLSG